MTMVAAGFALTTMSSSDAASEVNGTAHNRVQASRTVCLNFIEWMLEKNLLVMPTMTVILRHDMIGCESCDLHATTECAALHVTDCPFILLI